ncbi:MAG: T9SS type A sorting domain-containing protein [Bacteroidales bacterium]|nr:T9SS type A sorting domain-containing protein [Bacteroidales bacterium]
MRIRLEILLLVLTVFSLQSFSQGRIKVMSYNLLNFNNYTSYCTAQNNPHEAKAGYLATIVANQQPDILCCCEVGGKNPTLTYSISYILGNSLNVNGVTRWASASASGNTYLNNALFYDKTKLKLVAQTKVDTDIREINIYKLKHLTSNDTLKVAIAHLKAGTGYESQRGTEIQQLVNYLIAQGNNDNFIVCGDFNVYGASEPAFQNLVNPSYLPVAFYDPVNQMGEWANNWNYSEYHTQSTHTDNNGCFSYGGMDDRFDFILMSGTIINGTKGITYHPNSYWAVGQDGYRFNGSIDSPQNNTLPSNVIDALYNMSDHLPVVAELDFGDVGYASESTDAGFQSIVQNPVSDVLTMRFRTEKPRDVSVDLYSSLGVLLRHYQANVLADEVLEYDVADLPNGAYIVNVRSEGVSVSHRVIKAE